MSKRRAVAYSQVFTASPAEAAAQDDAIANCAVENGIEIVETFHDAEAGHSEAFEQVLARHCQGGKPVEIVAFDASRTGRDMPEIWRQVPCEKCGELKTIAAIDGELIAGCDLELC